MLDEESVEIPAVSDFQPILLQSFSSIAVKLESMCHRLLTKVDEEESPKNPLKKTMGVQPYLLDIFLEVWGEFQGRLYGNRKARILSPRPISPLL